MFIKKTHSKGKTYVQIVQSYRDKKGKPKHRVILSLGREDSIEDGFLEELMKKLTQLSEKLILLDKREQFLGGSLLLGPVLAIESVWKKLGLDTKLAEVQNRYKIEFDLNKAVKLMVLNRLLAPKSKLGVDEWKHRIYGDFADVQLQHLYRSLDILADNKDFLERELYETSQTLFKPEIRLVFYDMTSTYFESVSSDEFRKFGYSKDNKTDCVQVLIGLLVSKDGIPLGYEIFPGNTYEGHTVLAMLNKLAHRFEIEKVVFVADKGILSKKVLAQIEQAGYEYIIAAKLPGLPEKWHEKILDPERYSKIGEGLWTAEMQIDGKRLVLGFSENRAQRDQTMRQQLIKRLTKKLSQNPNETFTKPAYRKYLQMGKIQVEIDEQKIAAQSRWDGFFGFYTNNQKLAPAQVIEAYKLLWQVEDSFRCLKSTIKLRPIFHWTPKRIEGHIMLCFLSFYILRIIQRKLHYAELDITPQKALEKLTEIRAVEIKTDSKIYVARTEITGVNTKILRALSCKIPSAIIQEINL